MADFVAGFLTMIKPYETTHKVVMLQRLELLMEERTRFLRSRCPTLSIRSQATIT